MLIIHTFVIKFIHPFRWEISKRLDHAVYYFSLFQFKTIFWGVCVSMYNRWPKISYVKLYDFFRSNIMSDSDRLSQNANLTDVHYYICNLSLNCNNLSRHFRSSVMLSINKCKHMTDHAFISPIFPFKHSLHIWCIPRECANEKLDRALMSIGSNETPKAVVSFF